ncbi:MAG: hypothetical protein Q9191_008246 [Dirinaria sp. TL-2023a]
MSKQPSQNGSVLPKRGADDGELDSHFRRLALETDSLLLSQTALTANHSMTKPLQTDICPVCKSSRYLNQSMRFLVNPECYHKMCESCVDRIFSSGPAPCPVAGCARTLRKQRFRKQTFEDIQVEREVDIRRRVASIFNRRQEEFTSLLAYNNYLEETETLTFNLLHNIDVEATERKLHAYAQSNAKSISKNQALHRQESASAEAGFAAEKERARMRRAEAIREEDDERREREEGRRELVDRLAKSKAGDADEIVKATMQQQQRVQLKKSSARGEKARLAQLKQQQQQQAKANKSTSNNNSTTTTPTFTIEGLKPAPAAAAASDSETEPEKAYDPFGGMVFEHDYYVLQDRYENQWLEALNGNPQIMAGGYDVKEYYARTMFEAFAGLGVFVGEEVAGRDTEASKETATAAAAAAAAAAGDGGEQQAEDVL